MLTREIVHHRVFCSMGGVLSRVDVLSCVVYGTCSFPPPACRLCVTRKERRGGGVLLKGDGMPYSRIPDLFLFVCVLLRAKEYVTRMV